MKRHFAFLLAAVAMMASACGFEGSDSPRQAPAADRAGAPPIVEPRDLATRAADPCGTLLSSAQLRQLGFVRAGVSGVDAIGAPRCKWEASGPGSRSIEASIVQGRDFFVDTYRTRPLPVFVPHDVDGLPAVDLKAFEGGPTCTTTVGVADGQTLDVDVARGARPGERGTDACAISRQVAEAIVSTLPPL